MKNKPADYYFKRLNEVPPQVKQTLNLIRNIDKEVLKKQVEIQKKREVFLQKLSQYQQNKHGQKYVSIQRALKRQKSKIKKQKHKGKNKDNQNSFSSSSHQEIEYGGSQRYQSKYTTNIRLKQQLTQAFKKIESLHSKMISLTKQKLQLSQKLYNCIDQPTQQMQRNISMFMPSQEDLLKKRYKVRRNRKDHNQEYVDCQPKYCYCKRPSFGLMVKCSSQSCINQWFHTDCLQQKSKNLTDDWFCKDCRHQVKTRNS